MSFKEISDNEEDNNLDSPEPVKVFPLKNTEDLRNYNPKSELFLDDYLSENKHFHFFMEEPKIFKRQPSSRTSISMKDEQAIKNTCSSGLSSELFDEKVAKIAQPPEFQHQIYSQNTLNSFGSFGFRGDTIQKFNSFTRYFGDVEVNQYSFDDKPEEQHFLSIGNTAGPQSLLYSYSDQEKFPEKNTNYSIASDHKDTVKVGVTTRSAAKHFLGGKPSSSGRKRQKRAYYRKDKHSKEFLEKIAQERLVRKREKNRELAAKSRDRKKKELNFLRDQNQQLRSAILNMQEGCCETCCLRNKEIINLAEFPENAVEESY
eukprot:snap_masked-scaffold_2-processed-gene-9.23-mRNA-1 protein AED:1.00 eAED:1.00 QI:0/-1/0/0/-1/1/1/0/316